MKKIFTIVLFICCLAVQQSQAQDTMIIKWNGELRLRSEADGRDFKIKSANNLFTLSRFRLGVSVGLGKGVSLFAQAQDSRTFGEEMTAGAFNTINNTKNLDIHQVYLLVDKFLLDELSVKFGRMALAYGNERIIGSVGWNNIGRSFDGLMVRYSAAGFGSLDFLALNTGEGNAPPAAATVATTQYKYDTGWVTLGAYYSNKFSSEFSGDVYALYDLNAHVSDKDKTDSKDTVDLARTTLGALLKAKVGAFFGEIEAAYQLGTIMGVNISAYMLAVSTGYEMGTPIISSASVNLDMLSGRKAGDADYKSFNPPYPTGHKFYGFMDYFIVFPLNTFDRGMMDIYLRLVSKPMENVSILAVLHNFSLQNNYTSATLTTASTALGQEVDIITQWKYSKALGVELGVAGFLPGDVMRDAFKASDVATYVYLTTTVNF